MGMCEIGKNGKITTLCPDAAKKRDEGRTAQADWNANVQLIAEHKRDLHVTTGVDLKPATAAQLHAELKLLERDQTAVKVKMDQRKVWLDQHYAGLAQAAGARRR